MPTAVLAARPVSRNPGTLCRVHVAVSSASKAEAVGFCIKITEKSFVTFFSTV